MDVQAILDSRQAKFKTTDVSKEVELQYDLGNLLATDLNSLDSEALRSENKEEYLKELTRDNTQLLLNKLWELPTSRTEGFVLAQLPLSTTILPREKPIPQPKPPTKWEQFAKEKGIRKTKRSRMVFDEKAQEWKPRWGYKRVNDPKEDWVLEVPENADPYEDQFEKRSEKRKEAIAKNEYQRLRNISRSIKGSKVKVPLPPPNTKEMGKHELTRALGMAKKATASVGKFTPALSKEPAPKREKKRQFAPVVGDLRAEKQKNLDILTNLSKNKPILDVKKATNAEIASQESNSRKRKAESGQKKAAKKTKRSKMGGKATFKPSSAKQQQQRHKSGKTGGRKHGRK